MSTTKKTARQRRIDQIHESAVKNFANHKIEQRLSQGMFRSWRCKADGTWCYGFDITTTPGTLIVTGDIGELIVQRADDMIAWSRGSVRSIDYFAEKVPHAMETKEWDQDVAEEWLDELEAEADEESGDESLEKYDKIKDLRSCLDDGEDAFFRELSDSGLIDGCDYPDLRNWKPGFLWCREAVIWFLANWKEGEAAG